MSKDIYNKMGIPTGSGGRPTDAGKTLIEKMRKDLLGPIQRITQQREMTKAIKQISKPKVAKDIATGMLAFKAAMVALGPIVEHMKPLATPLQLFGKQLSAANMPMIIKGMENLMTLLQSEGFQRGITKFGEVSQDVADNGGFFKTAAEGYKLLFESIRDSINAFGRSHSLTNDPSGGSVDAGLGAGIAGLDAPIGTFIDWSAVEQYAPKKNTGGGNIYTPPDEWE